MNEEIRQALIDFCEDSETTLYTDYSGRSMYGSKCVGLSLDNPAEYGDLIFFMHERLGSADFAVFQEKFRGAEARTDNLGRKEILYFPDIEFND